MKIRTPTNTCIICQDNGEPIITATGTSTYKAVRRMRKFIEDMIAEKSQLDTQTVTLTLPPP